MNLSRNDRTEREEERAEEKKEKQKCRTRGRDAGCVRVRLTHPSF